MNSKLLKVGHLAYTRNPKLVSLEAYAELYSAVSTHTGKFVGYNATKLLQTMSFQVGLCHVNLFTPYSQKEQGIVLTLAVHILFVTTGVLCVWLRV